MMRLSTLWRVDQLIGPDERNPLAEQILAHWEHDPGSARFVRSSANFVYAFRAGSERRFLRFADDGERGREAIESEVALVQWLAAEGLPVARPLPSRHGTLVESVTTDLGLFHAAVFTGLTGAQPEIEELDARGFRRWGESLGRLHAATSRYPGAATAARPTWQVELAAVAASIPEGAPAVRRELGEVTIALAELPVSPTTYGLIHGDFELDNLFWQDGVVAMLDFDDCAHHWYAADIALALRDLFADGIDLDSQAFRAFVDGYGTQHPVDAALAERLPLFLRMAKLVEYGRIVRALDLPVAPGYPEWLTALVRKLEHRKAAYEARLEASPGRAGA